MDLSTTLRTNAGKRTRSNPLLWSPRDPPTDLPVSSPGASPSSELNMEWTEADTKRAAKEGWKYRNGYVAPIQTEFQHGFITTFDVVKYLARKAQTSKWHRDLYMELPWTDADDNAARAYGWRLWVRDGQSVIWSCDRTRFNTSEDAQDYVREQATKENPDPLCIKAISKLTKLRLLQGT